MLTFTENTNAIKCLISFKINKCYIKFNKVNYLPIKLLLIGWVFEGKEGYFTLS